MTFHNFYKISYIKGSLPVIFGGLISESGAATCLFLAQLPSFVSSNATIWHNSSGILYIPQTVKAHLAQCESIYMLQNMVDL